MTVSRLEPSQDVGECERWMTCNGCGAPTLVCCYVDDLEPAGWRCIRCRIATTGVAWPESVFNKPGGVKA